MRLLLNSIICVAGILLPVVTDAQQNEQTQSAIYDAITVMNAVRHRPRAKGRKTRSIAP